MSCRNPVGGIAVIVVTQLPEDDGEELAFLVHEDCQNALIKDLPYRNSVDQSAATGRHRS